MLFLHLSDIHFRSIDIATPLDPNAALRAAIIEDAKIECRKLGRTPDAILVSGDIAYAGKDEEYEYAVRWLEELASATGARPEDIVVIPGNHDVDRSLASRSVNAMLHKAIQDDTVTAHNHLKGLLLEPQSAQILYEPLDAYNRFAQRYLCVVAAPLRTRVFREFPLNDGSKLHVWGLNSAFLSGPGDRKESLFYDSASLQIARGAGVEHLVMIHHPPEWLRDGSKLRDHLDSVARLHLFGHEHTSRVEQHTRFARVRAGSANPDRDETGWEPGYNLIELEVEGRDSNRRLSLRIHARAWQEGTGRFRAMKTPEDDDVYVQSIALAPWSAPKIPAPDVVPLDPEGEAVLSPPAMSNLRSVARRFFALPLSRRSQIVGELKLVHDEDAVLTEIERMRRAIERARELGLIKKLEEAVAESERAEGTAE